MSDMDRTRVVMVTGAAGDLGMAIASRFAKNGATVVACDRNGEALRSRVEARTDRGRFDCRVTDLRDVDAVASLASAVLHRHQRVDVLVNNAAVQLNGDVLQVPVADFDESFAVNVRAPFVLARSLAPAMRDSGGGCIVNIASVMGVVAGPAKVAYTTTKTALLGLTRSMAVDLGRFNIRVNSVLPTATRTSNLERAWAEKQAAGKAGNLHQHVARQHPMGRIAEPDDVAEVVEFLAESRFVSGEEIRVDGGLLAALRLQPQPSGM